MITSFKAKELGIGFDFDISLEPDKQVYCFIGKNGVGKTQLLEAMAKSLLFSHAMFQKVSDSIEGDLFWQKTVYEKLSPNVLKLPLDIAINGISIKDKAVHHWGDTALGTISGLRLQSQFVCDKPIVFIGAKNRGFAKNIDSNNIKILADAQHRFVDSFQRTLAYINGDGLEQQEIADWFASRLIINPNFVINNQNRVQEAVTVLQLMDRLEPGQWLVSVTDHGEPALKLTFSEGQLLINNIPLDKLSTGYVAIIKIFQEVVAGYSGWTNATQLNEVEGIVFIDELEAHLHISWQTKIIALLREFFPKTTFFIATHSPLVLAGLKSGEGYELVREADVVTAQAIHQIENYFLQDIVKEFFGVDLSQEKIAHTDKARQQKAKSLLLALAKTMQEEGGQ